MKNHDVWKSKRFVTTFFGNVVGLALLLLGAYTEVEIPNADVIVGAIVVLWPLLVGGYSLEDTVVAQKAGSRAKKYEERE